MTETRERYFLSLDARLEEGGIYHAEMEGGDRMDLINELGEAPGAPDFQDVRMGEYRLAELPQEIYQRVFELRATGGDAEEAERLIAPFLDNGEKEGAGTRYLSGWRCEDPGFRRKGRTT